MKPKKQDKYARYKLASIPILLCVLAYVIVGQTQESDSAPIVPTTIAQVANPMVGTQASSPSAAKDQHLPWPEATLPFLGQTNPLANYRHTTAPKFVQSAEMETAEISSFTADPYQTLIDGLTGNQVDYVFQSDRRKLVMLGEHIFEKGQRISETVHLQDIQDNALIVTRHAPLQGSSESNHTID